MEEHDEIRKRYESPPPSTVSIRSSSQTRCHFVKLPISWVFGFSLFWGFLFWHAAQFVVGNPTFYEPPFTFASVWVVTLATLVCCFDFKQVFTVWLGVFCGAYLLHFFFLPPDPLVPLGIIMGCVATAFLSYAGMVLGIGLNFAFNFLRSEN